MDGFYRCFMCKVPPLVVCATALLWTQLARADSALGTESQIGNELNFGLLPLGHTIDPQGYSLFYATSFSPSGLLYPLVHDNGGESVDLYRRSTAQADADAASAENNSSESSQTPDWQFNGGVEAGYLATFGTTDTATFREYGDWDQEFIVSRIALDGFNARSGEHLAVQGGALGRDDQYLRVNYGRYGAYNIDAWYNQIPHTFTTNARVLWDGVGSGNLTLPAGLEPGASTVQEVRAALAQRGESTLKLERDRLGLALTATPWQGITLFVNGLTEWRDGARPFGGTFNYPTLGQVTETVEPIDYVTHEVDLGLRYSGRDYQASLVYNGSFFDNHTETLVWENPGLSLFQPDFIPPRGRFALAPDNRFHQIKGDVALALPFLNGRWTSSLAYNRKSQDDALLPPTISTGVGNNTGLPVDFDLFNTTAALSRRTADALIETYFLQGELSLQPTRRLRTALEFRYVGEDNHTDYTALNPLNGLYGYISEDGGNIFDNGIFEPGVPGDVTRIRNAPYEKDERRLRLTTDYRLASRMKLGLSYEHLELDYALRERDDVQDDRVRLQFTDRSGPWASLRLAGEYARRSGDDYNLNPLAPLLSINLPGFVPLFADNPANNGLAARELADLRVFDLSSRDEYVGDLQLRFTPGLRSSLGVNVRYVQNDFDADFGLRETERISANAEWNYQFADDGSAFVYYSFQTHDREAANINDVGPAGVDGGAGSATFPLENAFNQRLDETNHAAGIGLTRQWRKFLFQADYTFGYARSRVAFDFASPAALAVPVTADQAGDNLPLQTFEQHVLRASVRYPITDRIAARVFYRLESINIDDFHYDGLTDPVVDNQLFLLAIPEDFTAHVLGTFIEITL